MHCCRFGWLFWLGLIATTSGCQTATPEQDAESKQDSASYRATINPVADWATLSASASSWEEACVKWHAAHDRLVMALDHGSLALREANRKVVATLQTLMTCRPSKAAALKPYTAWYGNLLELAETGAPKRSLLHRYETIETEISQRLNKQD